MSTWGDLFILTDEPELTRFEDRLLRWLYDDVNGMIPLEELKPVVQARAKELLALARKEIEEELKEKVLHDYWKQASDQCAQARKDGKAEALKDLPRWNNSRWIYEDGWIQNGFLYYKNHSIPLKDLEKLPGFNE